MSESARSLIVGASNPELNAKLSRELDAFNVAATGDDSQRSLSVEARLDNGELVGGLMGWTWGTCAGVEMLWVDEARRRDGSGARLMAAAENEARSRGCVQVLVSSFTFQAPDSIAGWVTSSSPGAKDCPSSDTPTSTSANVSTRWHDQRVHLVDGRPDRPVDHEAGSTVAAWCVPSLNRIDDRKLT